MKQILLVMLPQGWWKVSIEQPQAFLCNFKPSRLIKNELGSWAASGHGWRWQGGGQPGHRHRQPGCHWGGPYGRYIVQVGPRAAALLLVSLRPHRHQLLHSMTAAQRRPLRQAVFQACLLVIGYIRAACWLQVEQASGAQDACTQTGGLRFCLGAHTQ